MIYITGDTHIPFDVDKLKMLNWKEQQELTKDDYLIICGDFGLIWRDYPTEIEKWWARWLIDKPFTTLFIDGNHENHKRLRKFNTHQWNGGEIAYINDSIYWLKRGEIYNIDGNTILCMGGAKSHDIDTRILDVSWWKEEIPNTEECEHCLNNLKKYNYKVDYIITHDICTSVVDRINAKYNTDSYNDFLDDINHRTTFKKWYFGHYHQDFNIEIDNKQYRCLYNDIIRLGE